MRRLIVIVTAVTMFFFVWLLASNLSSDAVAMAVGLVFGVLSMLPAYLIVRAGEEDGGPAGDLGYDGGPDGNLALDYPPPARVLRVERVAPRSLPGPSARSSRRRYIDYEAEREEAAAHRRQLEASWAAFDAIERATPAEWTMHPGVVPVRLTAQLAAEQARLTALWPHLDDDETKKEIAALAAAERRRRIAAVEADPEEWEEMDEDGYIIR